MADQFDFYWSKEDIVQNTPSRRDDISYETETRYRKEGALLIYHCCTEMKLRNDTQATGVVFFQRFFMFQSFKQFDRFIVATACFLLAGKVEENPKKCKDILAIIKETLTEEQFKRFGKEPKEEVLIHERILLQTIKFDLMVENPYTYVPSIANKLLRSNGRQLNPEENESHREKMNKMNKVVQMAWNFVNDSLCTTLCLMWEAQTLAVAFIFLAAKEAKVEIPSLCGTKRSWWRQFIDRVDVHDLEDIGKELKHLYEAKDKMHPAEAANPPDTNEDPSSIKDTPTPTPVVPLHPPVSAVSLAPSLVLPVATSIHNSPQGPQQTKIPSAMEVAANYARQRQQSLTGLTQGPISPHSFPLQIPTQLDSALTLQLAPQYNKQISLPNHPLMIADSVGIPANIALPGNPSATVTDISRLGPTLQDTAQYNPIQLSSANPPQVGVVTHLQKSYMSSTGTAQALKNTFPNQYSHRSSSSHHTQHPSYRRH